jgi:protein TonB
VNDTVDRLIMEREALDAGFSSSVALSFFVHGTLLAAVVLIPYLRPKEPLLRVQDGFAVPMPPGGGGVRTTEPPAPAPPKPEASAPPKAEPPPKVLKPPRDEPKSKGLPTLDSKTTHRRTEDSKAATPASGGAPGGTGTSAATPGLEFAPPGPGVPGGTDWLGDWYMAGVQRKIWMIWQQQIRGGTPQPVAVVFTILADGTVTDVRVAQSSGAFLLDQAAQRAVYSAAPFGPLPKDYGTNRITIQAIFKPAS